MKILLIDDRPKTRESIKNYLSLRFTAHVQDEPSGPAGKEAGDRALTPPWDAVVIDRSLPYDRGTGVDVGDGLSVAAIFRKDPNYSQAPIIVYSVQWIHKDDPAINAKHYNSSGIFLCESAEADKIGDLIAANLGKGPWNWQVK